MTTPLEIALISCRRVSSTALLNMTKSRNEISKLMRTGN